MKTTTLSNSVVILLVLLTGPLAMAADAPKVQRALPLGGQSGKTHQVTLTGSFPSWPIQFWADSADLTIKASEKSGAITIAVAPQAAPGVRYYRAYDNSGASELIPFLVDQCGDLLELEPNDHHLKAQMVELLPSSVHGCLEKSGDVDTFQIALRQGQTLVASLDAERFLGSPMDADLQVLTSRGVVLAQQLDHHGLDPEIKFTAPSDGTYLVRLMAFPDTPNSTIAYAGGEKFVYRLMLTTGPFIETALPACLSRLQDNVVQLLGPNISTENQNTPIPAVLLPVDRMWFSAPGFQGLIELPITSATIIVESEPNESKSAQAIAVPSIVSGTISSAGDRDAYQFHSEQGQRWKLAVEAREHGSPLDAVLTIFNSEGKQLATSDDVGDKRDAALSFAAAATGEFTAVLHDMYRHGSPQHWYRLMIEPELPEYALSVGGNFFTGIVGQAVEIVVNVQRKLDFAGDVTIGLETALPSGANPRIVSKKSDDTAKSVKLVIQADQPYSGPIRIVGQTDAGMNRIAKPEKAGSDWLWLTIAP